MTSSSAQFLLEVVESGRWACLHLLLGNRHHSQAPCRLQCLHIVCTGNLVWAWWLSVWYPGKGKDLVVCPCSKHACIEWWTWLWYFHAEMATEPKCWPGVIKDLHALLACFQPPKWRPARPRDNFFWVEMLQKGSAIDKLWVIISKKLPGRNKVRSDPVTKHVDMEALQDMKSNGTVTETQEDSKMEDHGCMCTLLLSKTWISTRCIRRQEQRSCRFLLVSGKLEQWSGTWPRLGGWN